MRDMIISRDGGPYTFIGGEGEGKERPRPIDMRDMRRYETEGR